MGQRARKNPINLSSYLSPPSVINPSLNESTQSLQGDSAGESQRCFLDFHPSSVLSSVPGCPCSGDRIIQVSQSCSAALASPKPCTNYPAAGIHLLNRSTGGRKKAGSSQGRLRVSCVIQAQHTLFWLLSVNSADPVGLLCCFSPGSSPGGTSLQCFCHGGVGMRRPLRALPAQTALGFHGLVSPGKAGMLLPQGRSFAGIVSNSSQFQTQ